MSDISVEIIDWDYGGDGATKTITSISNMADGFFRNNVERRMTAGPTGSTANSNIDVWSGGAVITGVTTLTGYRAGSNTATVKLLGEVWRYTGSASGSHEFIVRGRHKVTIASGSTTNSAAVSGISNRDDCVPFITGQVLNAANTTSGDQGLAYAYIDASDNLQVVRNNSGTALDVYVTVVEFTGSAWSVGHGKVTLTNGGTDTITLNTASIGSGGSTFNVTSWDKAFIEATMSGDAGTADYNIEDTSIVIGPGSGTSLVDCTLESSATCDGEVFAHAINNTSLDVNRQQIDQSIVPNGSYNNLTWPAGSPTGSTLTSWGLEWSCYSDGGGTAMARGSVGGQLYWSGSANFVREWCHRSGNTGRYKYGVIDLSGLSPVGITDMEDEQIDVGETDNVITGFGFEASQGTGKVELASTSDYATATKVTQTIDSWADTSIQFDSVQGALTAGQVYLFVTNNSSERSGGYAVWLGPHITDMEDELILPDETDNVITGAGFESSQGTGKVELVENNNYTGTKVTQTIDSWANTSIQFDSSFGALADGVVYLYVTTDSGDLSNAYAVTIGQPTYQDVVEALSPDHLWKFQNSYTDEINSNSFNLVTSGSPVFVTTPKICRGDTHSHQLDGTTAGQHIEAANSNYINIGSPQTRRYMGGWIQLDRVNQQMSVIYEEGAQINNIAFLLGFGNILMAQVADTSDDYVQAFSDFNLVKDRSYHIMFKFEASAYDGEVRLFIDGLIQTRTSGNPWTPSDLDNHSGDISMGFNGDTAGLEVGGTDIQFATPTKCFYSHWATWSALSLTPSTDIRVDLFEKGAKEAVLISSDTEANMQTALDVYADTVRPDAALCIKVAPLSGGGNLELTSDNITFNSMASIQIQYTGTDTLTWINENGSATTASKLSTPYSGTITVIEAPAVTITVKKASDSSVIQNARVVILADTGGDLPYQDSVTITRSGTTATVSHTAHGLRTGLKVLIEDANQEEYNGIKTITVTTTNAYTYTVSGTPATPATGTIVATSVIIHDISDVNGEVTVNHRYTSSQPVTGYARLGTSSPYYKEGSLSSTITSAGLTENIFLISDE